MRELNLIEEKKSDNYHIGHDFADSNVTSRKLVVSSIMMGPRRVGSVVNMSASHADCRGFVPQPGHTKDHQ